MTGCGISHGALSVINAIASGKGAAFGISLETRAEVDICGTGFSLEVNGNPANPDFAKQLVLSVCPDASGAKIRTKSNIPAAKGLKSSSAAANAILLAACSEAGLEMRTDEMLKNNTRASKTAGVSITGALDDAAASLLGGLVFSDNTEGQIIERRRMPKNYAVVIHVPPDEIPTCTFPAAKFQKYAAESESLFEKARAGDIFSAMYENGALVADALRRAPDTADFALKCGASAAGISGCGPATGILVEKDCLHEFFTEFGRKNCITAEIWNGGTL
ncbi:MAG TPA: shikimate kinase [Methanocorpusculum sp.]|nr:shikimate kinase [Methanocorpusculum sp.]